jgi:DNA-binding transcriptional LysR family regulator
MAQRRYYKEARFESFRTFCKVARLQSYAAAARALELSRPTVWQQIDSLEREFGLPLLAQAGRSVILTDAGRLLLELVQPNVAAMDSLKEVIQARLTDQGGVLRLACVQGNELHQPVQRFRERFPRVHLVMVELRSIAAVKLVEDGQCDLGFALYSPAMPRSPVVHYEPVGQRTFTLIAPPRHPLILKRRLRLADIVKYPLIVFPQDNPLRQHVERVFAREGLLEQMQVTVESDSADTTEQCAHLGMGVGIGLLSPRRRRTARVAFRSLAEHFGSLPLCLLWEKGAHLLPHVEAFVEMTKASVGVSTSSKNPHGAAQVI